jgi:hypothetical protein
MFKKLVSMILLITLFTFQLLSTKADDFAFSRNGITWESTWKQVIEAEAQGNYMSVYTKAFYPGFKNLEIDTPTVAGFEATSINYLFYNENFLAIYYEFGQRFQPSGKDIAFSFAVKDRNNWFAKLILAMNSKYGNTLSDEQDWLNQNLSLFPESLLEFFDITISSHKTWQVASNTIASLIFFNEKDSGGSRYFDAALAFLNLEKIEELGFDVLPGINTEGL